MRRPREITTLFLDVGGVVLTNGWDHGQRMRAAKRFDLDWREMEVRHRLNFEVHEQGKITLEEYMDRVVFYEERPFTPDQFRLFMLAQSRPYPKMIGLVARLRAAHGLKVAVVSNEARALNEYRIREFKLDAFVDSFISSCFVHLRKPDPEIFRLAQDIAHSPAEHVLYIDDTAMFVEVAAGMGIRGIVHTDYESTRAKLASFGLPDAGGDS